MPSNDPTLTYHAPDEKTRDDDEEEVDPIDDAHEAQFGMNDWDHDD